MKITLATLPKATAQQVFDHIARRMRAQGFEQSSVGGKDATMYSYRDMNGRAGPAGHCMSDAEYADLNLKAIHFIEESIEGSSWSEIVAAKLAPTAHAELIQDMQLAHDKGGTPEDMRSRLEE